MSPTPKNHKIYHIFSTIKLRLGLAKGHNQDSSSSGWVQRTRYWKLTGAIAPTAPVLLCPYLCKLYVGPISSHANLFLAKSKIWLSTYICTYVNLKCFCKVIFTLACCQLLNFTCITWNSNQLPPRNFLILLTQLSWGQSKIGHFQFWKSIFED